MTERPPPVDPKGDEPDDENPEFDRFEAMTKRLLEAKPARDGPPEVEDAAEQEVEYPEDETNEG